MLAVLLFPFVNNIVYLNFFDCLPAVNYVETVRIHLHSFEAEF